MALVNALEPTALQLASEALDILGREEDFRFLLPEFALVKPDDGRHQVADANYVHEINQTHPKLVSRLRKGD